MSAEVGTKRKNDENAAPLAAKKPRGKAGKAATSQAVAADDPAASLVDAVLANPDAYPIPEKEDDVRASLVELASYARSLEQVIAQASKSAAAASVAIAQVAAPVKTPEQLEAEAAKIARAAQSGIKKQMKVRSSANCVAQVSSKPHMSSGSRRARTVPRDGYTTVYVLIPQSLESSWVWMARRSSR